VHRPGHPAERRELRDIGLLSAARQKRRARPDGGRCGARRAGHYISFIVWDIILPSGIIMPLSIISLL